MCWSNISHHHHHHRLCDRVLPVSSKGTPLLSGSYHGSNSSELFNAHKSLRGPYGERYICGYEIRETVKKGPAGRVMLGRSPTTGEVVAIKIIKKQTAHPLLLSKFKSKRSAMEQLPDSIKLLHYTSDAVYPSRYFGTWEVVCLVTDFGLKQDFDAITKDVSCSQAAGKKGMMRSFLSRLADAGMEVIKLAVMAKDANVYR